METEVMKNYYELLDIDTNATSFEIRKKYLEKKFGSKYSSMTDDDRNLLEKAYNTLSDEVKRIKYNQSLDGSTIKVDENKTIEKPKKEKISIPVLVYSIPNNKCEITNKKTGGRIIDIKTGTISFSETYTKILDDKISTLLGEPGNSYILDTLKEKYENQIDLLSNTKNVREKELKKREPISHLEIVAYMMCLQRLSRKFGKAVNQINEYNSYNKGKTI